jgi:capsular exopolysaccharide synthesis family protein
VLACLLLIPAGVYVYSARLPKAFQAHAVVQPIGGGSSAARDIDVVTVATFAGTPAVADEAARRLGLPAGSLLGAAFASPDPVTGYVTIYASSATPARAAQVANAFAAALGAARAERGHERLDAALRLLRANLQLTPASESAQRLQLEQSIRLLEAQKRAPIQGVKVIEPARGAAKVSPHPVRNTSIAVLLALLVGLNLLRLLETLDRKLRKPDDLERLSGRPFLGLIPNEAFAGGDDGPDAREAFQTLRDSLTYFNSQRPLPTLMVCSALKGEGKTTVATNLGRAYAALGKRVVLVDVDLRKPELAKRLGLAHRPGLTDVLAADCPLGDALAEVPATGGTLRVLGAGTTAPDPSRLLGSQRMGALLDELEAMADVVILDSAPLLVISDAFPLLERVAGIVGVARLDSTPRAAIKRLVKIAGGSGASLLGFVATDARPGTLTGFGYGHGYGSGYGYANG